MVVAVDGLTAVIMPIVHAVPRAVAELAAVFAHASAIVSQGVDKKNILPVEKMFVTLHSPKMGNCALSTRSRCSFSD